MTSVLFDETDVYLSSIHILTYCHRSSVGFASLDHPVVCMHAKSLFRQKHNILKRDDFC